MKTILLCLWVILIIETKKLLLIQEVFRHGARFPIYIYETDYSNVTRDWKSEGELTTEGKNMHYILGKRLYQQYWLKLFQGTPFQDNYNQSKIFVKSTDVNRTIESAQSQLMGLLSNLKPLSLPKSSFQFSQPPWPNLNSNESDKEWNIYGDTGMSFHPIAIHVQKAGANLLNDGDFLIAYDQVNCPNQKFWQLENLKSSKGNSLANIPLVKQALTELSKVIGTKVSFQNAYKYIDNYKCLKYLKLPYLPIYQDKKYKQTFEFIKVSSLYLSLYYTPTQRKVSSVGFFQATINSMNKIIKNRNSEQIIIYSAHDTTVAAVLSALNFTNVDCLHQYYIQGVKNTDSCIVKFPPFASNVIFELWQDNNKYTIRMLYNGEPRKIPFCNWETQCQYNKFQEWFNDFRINNIKSVCGITSSLWRFAAAISILGVIIIIMLGYIYCEKKKKHDAKKPTQQKYHPHVEEKQAQIEIQ